MDCAREGIPRSPLGCGPTLRADTAGHHLHSEGQTWSEHPGGLSQWSGGGLCETCASRLLILQGPSWASRDGMALSDVLCRWVATDESGTMRKPLQRSTGTGL